MLLVNKLKEDVLTLVDAVQTKKAREGDPWSDTKTSQMCFGHGEFVGNLKKWEGGRGGPMLEKMQVLEQFLREQLGDAEYAEVISNLPPIKVPQPRRRTKKPTPPKPDEGEHYNDFD